MTAQPGIALYLPKDAAVLLHRSPSTLANWRRDGIGPDWIKEAGTVLYPEPWIWDWLESGRNRRQVRPLDPQVRDWLERRKGRSAA